jgi:ADP-ribose pyrophosphatase YjhB (NUDIX family)
MACTGVDDPKISEGLLRRLEELAAIAQNGLTFAKDTYDLERYRRLQTVVAEMMGLVSGHPSKVVDDWLCLDTNYATPKVDVRALVLRGDDVLLVQERSDGCWTLPGGWCEVNESPKEAIEKEVWEESGLRVEASRLLALLDKQKHDHPFQIPHAYKCFFLCEERSGSLIASTTETSGAAFWPWTALPPLSLHRVTPKQVEMIVSIARDPSRPTVFD